MAEHHEEWFHDDEEDWVPVVPTEGSSSQSRAQHVVVSSVTVPLWSQSVLSLSQQQQQQYQQSNISRVETAHWEERLSSTSRGNESHVHSTMLVSQAIQTTMSLSSRDPSNRLSNRDDLCIRDNHSPDHEPVDLHSPDHEPVDLNDIQQRLEARVMVRKNLVEHPLNSMWGYLVWHLAREIFYQDIYVRAGLGLIGVGGFLQSISFCMIAMDMLTARVLFLVALFLLSCAYVLQIGSVLESLGNMLSSQSAMVDAAFGFLEGMDHLQLRRCCIFVAMIPTMLEMRALAFLSGTIVLSGLVWTFSITVLVGLGMTYMKWFQNASARDSSIVGALLLYVSALGLSILHLHGGLKQINTLAAPFLLAAGAFTLSFRSNQDEWFSQAIRQALRLTLKDVMASIGDKVAEDEMLQLSILRWLVDFWSLKPNQNPNETDSPPSTNNDNTYHGPDNFEATESTENRSQYGSDQGLGWPELLPMLEMTTDQMVEEMQELAPYPGGNPSPPFRMAMDPPADQENKSIGNLKSMLASLDVDERAKPAVLAFKQSMANFPPSKNLAEFFAVMRRCPAILCSSYLILMGSWNALSISLNLLPLMIFEVIRIREWIASFHLNYPSDSPPEEGEINNERALPILIHLPKDIDPMYILLSGDDASHRCASIQVWENVKSSVSALESGLTAVRCVQTTALAIEFAEHVVSLTHFGMEVYRKGLLHGLSVLSKEMFHFHIHSRPVGQGTNTDHNNNNTRYTNAAIGAARNGHLMAKNVSVLLEEEGGSDVLGAVVNFLPALIGRGWLWGKEDNRDDNRETGAREECIKRHDHESGSTEMTESINRMGQHNGEGAEEADKRDSEDHPSAMNDTIGAEIGAENDVMETSALIERIQVALERGLIDDVRSLNPGYLTLFSAFMLS
eukprot:scaffold101386_cov58-Attheya_sp.AAC.5